MGCSLSLVWILLGYLHCLLLPRFAQPVTRVCHCRCWLFHHPLHRSNCWDPLSNADEMPVAAMSEISAQRAWTIAWPFRTSQETRRGISVLTTQHKLHSLPRQGQTLRMFRIRRANLEACTDASPVLGTGALRRAMYSFTSFRIHIQAIHEGSIHQPQVAG